MRTNWLYILLSVYVASCHNAEKVQKTDDNKLVSDTSQINQGDGNVFIQLNYTGVVKDMSKKDGCGWMIELDMGKGEKQLLEPLVLEEKYQIDGKSITFTFTDSRRQSKCSIPSKPITINSVID